jgi:hypothetical protein
VTRNGSPKILKLDAPFGAKYVVTPVVTWIGGLCLVRVHVGGAYKRRHVVVCLKGSNRDQGAIRIGNWKIQRPGGQADLVEVGVCIMWYQS